MTNERSILKEKRHTHKPEQEGQAHVSRTGNESRNYVPQKPTQNKAAKPAYKITSNNDNSAYQPPKQQHRQQQQPQQQHRQQQPQQQHRQQQQPQQQHRQQQPQQQHSQQQQPQQQHSQQQPQQQHRQQQQPQQQHRQQQQPQQQHRQQQHKKDHQQLPHKKAPAKPPVFNMEIYRNKVKGFGGNGLSSLELEHIHSMLQNDTLGVSTREEILSLIAEEGNTISLPSIYKMLTNKSVRLREKALHVLYFAFQDRNAIPYILERLRDPNEHTEVRRKALSALKLFRSQEAVSPILDFISVLSKRTPTTPHDEAATKQEIEDALDALAILLTLTENAHAFSLARGKGRKELFARLLEACDTKYKVDLGYMESALIIS